MQKIDCPDSYKKENACAIYFYGLFYKVRTNFTENFYKKYIDKIKNMNDPILRHTALYLIENYEESKVYFDNIKYWKSSLACEMLNKWLDNKRSFFTHGEKCETNVNMWKNHIESIWDDLNNNNTSANNRCERKEIYAGNAYIPSELLPPVCYLHVPENYVCVQELPSHANTVKSMCPRIKDICTRCKSKELPKLSTPENDNVHIGECPLIDKTEFFSSPQRQIYCEECPSTVNTVASTVFSTFLGTYIILFLLYKFTPLGSLLSKRTIKKKRLKKNFMQEVPYEECESPRNNNTQHGSIRNNIYYQYMQN
ncbi:variable surface protein [Plasmodium gonderi]|uniref:Variable surface protein n=1 Tax=Plasmodium gonderi TaxID=77519 RepID=A0A1Y1JWR2_PLAGO|nr:variable surface protein [Plasmodium gonderi]GAW84264.1 variable surface protein [Plasmodium gonderi]